MFPIVLISALDPRFKSLALIEDQRNQFQLWDGLLNAMIEQKKLEDRPQAGNAEDGSRINEQPRKRPRWASERSAALSKYTKLLDEEAEPADVAATILRERRSVCTAELAMYQSEPSIGLAEDEDPLKWWQQHHHRFPNLWKLAQLYLAVPIASAAPGRAHNSSTNQALKNSDDLIFLKENPELLEE